MRITSRARSAAAIALVTAAVAAPSAQAAANGLEVSSENITPPEDVGRRIDVGLRGRVTAISPGRLAGRCRGYRQPYTLHTTIGGEKYQRDFRPASRAGRFNVQFELEYGGIDEEGSFFDGDVPLSGGRVTITVKVTPKEVPRAISPSDLKLYKCKALKATTVVEVAPSR